MWAPPALFLASGILLLILSHVKRLEEPTHKGVRSLVVGIALILIGVTFLGVHYLL